MNLKVSAKMHEDLLYAANFYQNPYGKFVYSTRRTEDALLRRGLITYDVTEDNYPVITVKGWAYLASQGVKRRAEDPGRLTLEEALEEAYRAPAQDAERAPVSFTRAEAEEFVHSFTGPTGALYATPQYRALMADATKSDGRQRGYVIREDAPAPEAFEVGQRVVVQRPGQPPRTGAVADIHAAPGYVTVLDDRNGIKYTYPSRFVTASPAEKTPQPPVTPEVVQALATLRLEARKWFGPAGADALEVLENAGVFAAIDAAPRCTCPPSYAANDQHEEGCPQAPKAPPAADTPAKGQCEHCRRDVALLRSGVPILHSCWASTSGARDAYGPRDIYGRGSSSR